MSAAPSPAIGEVVEQVAAWTPGRDDPNGELIYVDLSAVDQDSKTVAYPRRLACKDAPSRARQIIRAGDVLVSTVRPNLNAVGLVPKELDGATASTGFCVLRPRSEKAVGAYLFHWVRSPRFISEMVRRATGASYPAVSDRIIYESKIPLPSLPEQRRIAEILNKADALRAKRRTALAQLDTLTQSIFLGMFGDPATNSKRWPVGALRSLGRVTTGGTPPSAKEGMFDGDIPFITPGDLESDHPVERTVTDAGAEASRIVDAGATLVCCIGTIGKIGKSTVRSAFNQQINAIEWSERVHADYGYAVMRFFKPTIIAWGSSTTLPILKKSSFERMEIPIPPMTQQQEFALLIERVERIRTNHRIALSASNELSSALQVMAFQGDL